VSAFDSNAFRRRRRDSIIMIYFRFEHPKPSLRRIRSLSDSNPSGPMEECVIQREPKKQIRARIGLIVQTYLRNVDCVRDVHTTLMTLVLTATLEVLAVEVWCPELRMTVDSKPSLKFYLSRHFLYRIFLMHSSCLLPCRTCIRV